MSAAEDITKPTLGKIMSYAIVEGEPNVPQNLQDQYRQIKTDMDDALRNMNLYPQGTGPYRMFKNMYNGLVRDYDSLGDVITGHRLGFQWH
jgi:hypothetical protein